MKMKLIFEFGAVLFGAYMFMGLNPQTWWTTILSFGFTWFTTGILQGYMWNWYLYIRKIYRAHYERKG